MGFINIATLILKFDCLLCDGKPESNYNSTKSDRVVIQFIDFCPKYTMVCIMLWICGEEMQCKYLNSHFFHLHSPL